MKFLAPIGGLRRGLVVLSAVLALLTSVRSAAAAAILVVDDDLACPGATYSTIQAAVTAAAAGDTIQVCAGTYVENVVINKSLTLLGAQAGVDARGRVASESIVVPAALLTATFNIAVTGTFTIDGFSFSGGPTGSNGVIFTSAGPHNNLQIVNNLFSNYPSAAIWMNRGGTDITIDKNVMDGSNIVAASTSQAIFMNGPQTYAGINITNNHIINNGNRYGIFVDGNHNVGESAVRSPLISGNFISNNLQGMNLGSRSFGTFAAPVLGAYGGFIQNNAITKNAFDGIQGGVQHTLITGNTIDQNGRNGIGLSNIGSANAEAGARNSDVVCNLIIRNGFNASPNNGSGIFLSAGQIAGTQATNKINNNNIHGNKDGLTYTGATALDVIDATNNWWGNSTGPTIASNPGGTGDSIVNSTNTVNYAGFTNVPSACAPADPLFAPTGTITVHKIVDAGSSPLTAFCFTLSPNPGNGQVCADAGGNAVFSNVPAGTYSATETSKPPTYHEVALSNNCTGLTITNQGDALSCDVHNAINTGTITVHKVVDSGSALASSFCFTLSPDPGNGQICANAAGDAVFSGVPADLYTVNETDGPPGYHEVSNTCSGLDLDQDGEGLKCEVHDAQNTGTLTVHKVLDTGSTPLTGFCFTLNPNPTGFGQVCANAAGDAVFTNVPFGTYSADETLIAAFYHFVSTTCNSSLTIANDGDTDSCEVHNAQTTGSISVHKSVDVGINPAPQFCFTLNPDPGLGQMCTAAGGTVTFNNVPPGTYSVDEAPGPAPYHFESSTCINLTIVNHGSSISCDVTNAIARGTITVHKVLDSGSEPLTSFCFTLSPDPGNGQKCANAAGDAVFTNVPYGAYNANETGVPTGYHGVSSTCVGSPNPALNIVKDGDAPSCEWHNAINRGTITVHKTIDAGSAAVTGFCFTLNPDPGIGQVCANAAGNAVFDNVPAGTYGATETSMPPAYHQVSNNCTALKIENVSDSRTCDVHNTINTGTITVTKYLDAGSAALTSFCFTLSPNPAGFSQMCANASGVATFSNVPADTYAVNETASPLTYHQVSNTCTGLVLATQGQSRSCAVHDAINTGTITVKKVVDAGGAAPINFCFTLSPNPAGFGQVCANASGNAVFNNVPSGTYSVVETQTLANYHQVSNNCSSLYLGNVSDSRSCEVHNTINTPTCETTLPTIGVDNVLQNPTRVILKVLDTGSGLKSISVISLTNATAPIPAFTLGTTSPVYVTATKINASAGSVIGLRAVDVCNNVFDFDPVDATVNPGKPEAVTFSEVPGEEHLVRIINDDLDALKITVNGHPFVQNLKKRELVIIDIGKAMVAGPNNTIVVQAKGPKGSSALVVVYPPDGPETASDTQEHKPKKSKKVTIGPSPE